MTMKKLFVLLSMLVSMNLHAQMVNAGFGCGDYDAWFDKEIYFWCQNTANYYGAPVDLSNVTLVADGVQFDLQGTWEYGTLIFLDASNGIKLEKGSLVSVYINSQCVGTWQCSHTNPSVTDVVKRAWSLKPKTKINANKILLNKKD